MGFQIKEIIMAESNHKKQTVKLGSMEVIIDPENMKFNESNLSMYLEREGSWYDYFGQRLADAEAFLARHDLEYDIKYADKFKHYKEQGSSDKLAEAYSKSEPEVEEAKKRSIASKHKVRLLQQHLRAWDKNHDNAQSRGHMIRKEMDKLNIDIYKSKQFDADIDSKVSEIIKEVDV